MASLRSGPGLGALPVGLQLVGRRRAEWHLLSIAAAFEAATGYAQIAPSLAS